MTQAIMHTPNIVVHHQMIGGPELERYPRPNGKPFVSFAFAIAKINCVNRLLLFSSFVSHVRFPQDKGYPHKLMNYLLTKNAWQQIDRALHESPRWSGGQRRKIMSHKNSQLLREYTLEFLQIGRWYLHWIHTRYIVNCLPRLTNSRRSAKFCSSTSPAASNAARNSSEQRNQFSVKHYSLVYIAYNT